MTSFDNGKVNTSNDLLVQHTTLLLEHVLQSCVMPSPSLHGCLGRQLAWYTVKQPQCLPQLPNLHFTLCWGIGSPGQCWGGSIHNSVCFLLLCLASCYAKIGRGGPVKCCNGERHTPTRSNCAGNSNTQAPNQLCTQRDGPGRQPRWREFSRVQKFCKSKKEKAFLSLSSFLSPPPPPFSLSLFSSSYRYQDHIFTSSCKRHSYVC